ncbi:hypothetical protein V8E51_003751 [Hyaloscypha variabilis]
MSDTSNCGDPRDSRERRNLVLTSRENSFGIAKGKGVTTGSPIHNGEPSSSSRLRSSKTTDSACPNTLDKGKGRVNIPIRTNIADSRDSGSKVGTIVHDIERRCSDATNDNGESSKDRLGSRTEVDEVERRLDEETRREAKYWEQVDKKKGQMKDVRGRKKKTRQDMLDDRFTEEDRKEFAAKYKRLEEVHKLAQEEIDMLEEQLAAAEVTIKRLRKALVEVRRELEEQENESRDLRKTIKDLRGQIKTLHDRLDVTESKLKKYEEKYPELVETDISTPTSSEVSSEARENGPTAQGPAIAGPSSTPICQTPDDDDDDAEKIDKQGSPSETAKNSDTGAALTRTPTRSSGTSSNKRRSWETVETSFQTHEYPNVTGGKVRVEQTKTVLIPGNSRHKSSSKDSHKKKKKSRTSKEQK